MLGVFFSLLASRAVSFPTNDAVLAGDSEICMWVVAHTNYLPGTNTVVDWQNPMEAYGPAEGDVTNIVSLGDSGEITLSFELPVLNGPGWDFAVFENSFNEYFLELAFVEVSADGTNFVRFPGTSLTPNPVPFWGAFVDPADVDKLAGKYEAGKGTPFDLDDVGLDVIQSIRLVDIHGNGSVTDSVGNVIYDPDPTEGSGGFDLDGIGARYPATELSIQSVPAGAQLQWYGLSNLCYTVQRTENLLSIAWTNLTTICPQHGQIVSMVDSNAPSHRIYRLEIK